MEICNVCNVMYANTISSKSISKKHKFQSLSLCGIRSAMTEKEMRLNPSSIYLLVKLNNKKTQRSKYIEIYIIYL